VLEEYQKQLTEAKQEANQVIADARATGEAVKADIQAKAQAEAAEIIAKAKQTIEAEKKAAIAELQGLIADTSVDVAARLIGNDLTEGDHRAIIEKYVKEAGSFNGN
jgi:F-type H+-transporting ATPase subunit b